MSDHLTRSAIDDVSRCTGIPRARICAAHESALQLLGLDNNAVAYAVDIVVSGKDYREVKGAEGEHAGYRYKNLGLGEIPVRVWRSQGLLSCAPWRSRELVGEGLRCLLPEALLRALPLSPDFEYLQEQYARLAEVLYFDRMTDAELEQFLLHVRE